MTSHKSPVKRKSPRKSKSPRRSKSPRKAKSPRKNRLGGCKSPSRKSPAKRKANRIVYASPSKAVGGNTCSMAGRAAAKQHYIRYGNYIDEDMTPIPRRLSSQDCLMYYRSKHDLIKPSANHYGADMRLFFGKSN